MTDLKQLLNTNDKIIKLCVSLGYYKEINLILINQRRTYERRT